MSSEKSPKAESLRQETRHVATSETEENRESRRTLRRKRLGKINCCRQAIALIEEFLSIMAMFRQ
jgi:hypothetical protein